MGNLPSGTVTFLFTDIEGSTRLLQQLGEAYASLLADHTRLLGETFRAHGGSVIDTQGDSFFVAFSRAVDAIQAVVEAQSALAAHAWPENTQVRVRMGVHTGEPQIGPLGYVGIDVHRAARIAAAAHGGQVLLSQTTYDLIEGELPGGARVRDLGEHRLKDLRQPKHLYQLIVPGLPGDFPPLKSLDTSPNNLPVQLTSFVGRSQEMAEVTQLLAAERLLTLTGPAGSGKTRLALRAAAEVLADFPDGVFFVALAPISDATLVASTIAQVLGVSEAAGRPILESLRDYLQPKSVLLVLDNFEQVIAAAPLVADLLAACRGLRIVVTSREGLHVRGEHEYQVPPLVLPDLQHLPALEALTQYAAVELFIKRAQAVKPDFKITNETAPAVAEICFRLDGLPLAIELAAARIKLLPPRAMLARLGKRLEFLTGGARDLPARQQTLRNAIAWSYDLLDEQEQQLFRRLAVFVGGGSVEAIEAVAANPETQAAGLDILEMLLDKSLLRQVEGYEGEPRFVMLQVLREFGREQLDASGESDLVRRGHATYFLALAEHAEARLDGADQIQWMGRLEQEHDNLRAALDWSRTAEGAESLCWRLAATLGYFWEVRGHYREGRERLSAILASGAAQARTAPRAKLLARAAELAYRQSDYPATIALAGESLAISREIGDRPGVASALIKLGNAATEGGDHRTAVAHLEEALTIARELEDKPAIARALINLGWAALRPGDTRRAKERLEEALTLSRELEDTRSLGFELAGLGEIALREGDFARATQLLEESLELRRELGNKWGVGVSLGTLGWVAMRQADWSRAVSRLGESLEVRREIGDKGGCAWCFERLAEAALAQGQAEKSARLLGVAAALRASIGSVVDSVDQPEYDRWQNSVRENLGAQRFAALYDEGRAMTLDQAIAYALEQG